jgi:hypothetical protein
MDPTAFDWTAQMESGLQLVLAALVERENA